MSIEPPAAVISRVKGTDGELQTFPGSIIIVGLLQQQQINKLDKNREKLLHSISTQCQLITV